MSISKSLLRAAKIQEKIDELRGQLAELLDQARAEVDFARRDEVVVSTGRQRPKMLKSAGAGLGGKPRTAATAKRGKEPRQAGIQTAGKSLRSRRSSLAGKKRAASPTGPLAPAVVEVLRNQSRPMNVRDILDGLLANGYQFNSAEPKKNLAARIYRLTGVKQVSAGLFGLA